MYLRFFEKDIVNAAKNQPFENQLRKSTLRKSSCLARRKYETCDGDYAALLHQKPAESLLCIELQNNGKTTTVSMIEQIMQHVYIFPSEQSVQWVINQRALTTQQDGHTTPESPFLQN